MKKVKDEKSIKRRKKEEQRNALDKKKTKRRKTEQSEGIMKKGRKRNETIEKGTLTTTIT